MSTHECAWNLLKGRAKKKEIVQSGLNNYSLQKEKCFSVTVN